MPYVDSATTGVGDEDHDIPRVVSLLHIARHMLADRNSLLCRTAYKSLASIRVRTTRCTSISLNSNKCCSDCKLWL